MRFMGATEPIIKELLAAWLGLQFENVRPGELVTLPVLSGSMSPHLMQGTEIKILCTSWRKCRIGDIVVFRETMTLIAHRLLCYLCVGGKWFLFQKGDSSAFGHWIRAEQVIGVVLEARGADGKDVDFRSAGARRRALACVCKQLACDLRARLLVRLGGIRRWVQRIGRSAVSG